MNPVQVEEILAADPQTAKELLYDIRQAAAGQRSAAAAAASARSGGAVGPWCRSGPGTASRLAHSTPGALSSSTTFDEPAGGLGSPLKDSCTGFTRHAAAPMAYLRAGCM